MDAAASTSTQTPQAQWTVDDDKTPLSRDVSASLSISQDAARSLLQSRKEKKETRWTFYNGNYQQKESSKSAADRLWDFIRSILNGGASWFNVDQDWLRRCAANLAALRELIEQESTPLWLRVLAALLMDLSPLETEEWWSKNSGPRYDSRPGSGHSFPREDAAGIYLFVGFLGGKMVSWYDGRSICLLLRLMQHLSEVFDLDGKWAKGRIQAAACIQSASILTFPLPARRTRSVPLRVSARSPR